LKIFEKVNNFGLSIKTGWKIWKGHDEMHKT
jgi:hypothetical protein